MFWKAMHSGIRWLAVMTAIIALLLLLVGVVTKGKYGRSHIITFSVLNGLLGIQFLLGVLLIIINKSASGNVIQHLLLNLAGIMIIATGSAGAKRASGSDQFKIALIRLLIGMVLIFIGVSRVNGW